jgi:hypothetical protein
MSVLNLPRFVFNGFTDWNPDTVNNSASIYNEDTAAPVPQPGIPFDKFVAWLLESNGAQNPANLQPNGSWNVFGDHGVTFMDPNGSSANAKIVTLVPASPSAVVDPLLGKPVWIEGLLYFDRPQPHPARMVDLEPYGPYSTQIYYENVNVGDAQVGVKGKGACRMFSRWPNMGRNLGGLPIAGNMGVLWQTAVKNADLTWSGVNQSPALAALKKAAESGGNQGIQVQFVSYRTLYYQTVTYQGRPIRTGGDLIWAYGQGYRGGNPARSVLVGVVGVWGPNELASAPTQRLLAPLAQVAEAKSLTLRKRLDQTPTAALTNTPVMVSLGPAVAIVEDKSVTVDFIATFPEADGSLEKADLGAFVLQSVSSTGTFLPVGNPLTFKQYNKAAYEANGGMAAFDFDPKDRAAIVSGTLQLVQQGAAGDPALDESQFVAETDGRGTYLDEGQSASIQISVYEKGGPVVTPVQLVAAQYDIDGYLITNPNNQIVQFPGNAPPYTVVLPVQNNASTLQFSATQPGICYIFFYPFAGGTPPVPPLTGFNTPSDYYAIVRVLPFDDKLEKDTPDSKLTFDFIYNNVLMTYDVIYPVMSQVRNLHNKNVVDAMAEQLKFAISLDNFQSTLCMPITRELSAGKRKLLQRYVNLLP